VDRSFSRVDIAHRGDNVIVSRDILQRKEIRVLSGLGQKSMTQNVQAGIGMGLDLLPYWPMESAEPLAREITIGKSSSSLGVMRIPEVNGQRMAHKNKYDREYDDAPRNDSGYEQLR